MKILLNLTETAKILCVSRKTLFNMIRDKRFDVKRYGKPFKFLQEDVLAWAARNDWNVLL